MKRDDLAPECPICGHRVYQSHDCRGTRARRPWVNKPSDFAARVQRARLDALQLPLDVDGPQQ